MPNRTEIPASLLPPTTEDCLFVVSKAILAVRAKGISRDKVGEYIKRKRDAVDSASNEENLLSFDSIALLCHYFPEEAAPIVALLTGRANSPTVEDRRAIIIRQIDAICRAVS